MTARDRVRRPRRAIAIPEPMSSVAMAIPHTAPSKIEIFTAMISSATYSAILASRISSTRPV